MTSPDQTSNSDRGQKNKICLEKVLADEAIEITERRKLYDVAPPEQDLAGLAISGGGIRVATFALGTLQSMAAFDFSQNLEGVAGGGETLTKSQNVDNGEQTTGLLGVFDYLSTVSGGGFIGSWLTSWIYRSSHHDEHGNSQRGLPKVADALARSVQQDKIDNSTEELRAEADEVTFLRRYSNYLTPRVGLMSADTWTVIAIYLRNFLLNIITLLLLGLAIVSGVFWLVGAVDWVLRRDFQVITGGWIVVSLMTILAFATFVVCMFSIGRVPRYPTGNTRRGMRASATLFVLTALVAVPGFAAMRAWGLSDVSMGIYVGLLHALPGALCILKPAAENNGEPGVDVPGIGYRIWTALCAMGVGFVSGFVAGYALHHVFVNPGDDWQADTLVVFGPVLILFASTVGIAVEVGFLSRSSTILEREWWGRLAAWLLIAGVVWTSVTAISFYAAPATYWMGWKLRMALGSGAFGLSALAAKFGGGSRSSGVFRKVITGIGPLCFVVCLAIGMSTLVNRVVFELTGRRHTKAPAEVLAENVEAALETADGKSIDVAVQRDFHWSIRNQVNIPYEGGSLQLERGATAYPQVFSMALSDTRQDLRETNLSTIFFAGVLAPVFAAILLSLRFDINTHSLNQAWANRIVRCYLGASNPRRRNSGNTGFDATDDVPLASLRTTKSATDAARSGPEHRTAGDWFVAVLRALFLGSPLSQKVPKAPDSRPYDGPYHLINGTMNVYSSSDLGRQERFAESFLMSPVYCGYTLASEIGSARQRKSYCETDEYAADLTLGTAVSVSAAAAASQMGYHTTPSLAALMTIFNVRVGRWLPNPALPDDDVKLKYSSPTTGLAYLGRELLSQTKANSNYVYVTDGGHFENLAIYELIRRRCRYIVAVDGEADAHYQFHGLGSIVRKARIDFGVDIRISAHGIQPVGIDKIRNPAAEDRVSLDDRLGRVNYALGVIQYPAIGDKKEEQGLLIYVKSSLVSEDALNVADVRQYAETHSTFPHETTADQFFSESQFESYRQLGQSVMARVLTEVLMRDPDAKPTNTGDGGEPLQSADSEGAAAATPLAQDSSTAASETRDAHQKTGKKTEYPSYIPGRLKALDRKMLRESFADKAEDAGVSGATPSDADETVTDKRIDQLSQLIKGFQAHCKKFFPPNADV